MRDQFSQCQSHTLPLGAQFSVSDDRVQLGGGEQHDSNPAAPDEYFEKDGVTIFSEPSNGRAGYGCAMARKKSWTNLVHEIGHALGLPHTSVSDAPPDSATLYAPWEDDTWSVDEFNVMDSTLSTLADTSSITITPNQIRRARLTAVSRDCAFLREFHAGAGAESLFPRLDDISARFLVQAFG